MLDSEGAVQELGVPFEVMEPYFGGFHWWGEVMWLDWSGVLELVECFLYISWHGYVQYYRLVVSVQCDATVKTPCPILCYLIYY